MEHPMDIRAEKCPNGNPLGHGSYRFFLGGAFIAGFFGAVLGAAFAGALGAGFFAAGLAGALPLEGALGGGAV